MTKQDLDFLNENKAEVVQRIKELTENMLGGDFVDVYFHLTDGNDVVDYGFNKSPNTIMMLTAQSQRFYKEECDGYVAEEGIELELERQMDFAEAEL